MGYVQESDVSSMWKANLGRMRRPRWTSAGRYPQGAALSGPRTPAWRRPDTALRAL